MEGRDGDGQPVATFRICEPCKNRILEYFGHDGPSWKEQGGVE